MTHHEHPRIIAFVGLPGSGKSTAVEYFTGKGHPKVYFGGVVLEAIKQAGREITPETEKEFREGMRETYGKDVIVQRIIGQIQDLFSAGQHHVIADGLYSWTEYKALKHAFPGELSVVAVVAPKEERYRRLAHRPVRPMTEQEVKDRDWDEIENLEKGGPIAIADYYVLNDDDTDEFYKELDRIANDIGF